MHTGSTAQLGDATTPVIDYPGSCDYPEEDAASLHAETLLQLIASPSQKLNLSRLVRNYAKGTADELQLFLITPLLNCSLS